MKKIFLTFIFMTAVFSSQGQTQGQAQAQVQTQSQGPERFFYAATIGIGFSMNEPAYTPVIVQVLGYYRFKKRWMAGLGTGLSFYETTLVPVFLDAKCMLRQARKFVPYLECGGGYAFAPGNQANGGLYCYPSLGVIYPLTGKMKLQLAAGYEFQQYERLKKYANDYLTVNFSEQRHHHAFSLKIGILL